VVPPHRKSPAGSRKCLGDKQLQAIFDDLWHRAALDGDAEATTRLATATIGPLYRFCLYRLGNDRHVCEEVVQETLVKAIRELDRYQPNRAGGNIFPWLSGLARNEIRRALSRENNTASLQTAWARVDEELREVYARLESRPFEDEVLKREETSEMVGATMSQIPQHYREALEAKYLSGKSVREMADISSVSEKAIESRLGRAREAFRATFLSLTKNLGTEPGT
jgi:RNA polymerase sigma-70 factor (ECF subfamily)